MRASRPLPRVLFFCRPYGTWFLCFCLPRAYALGCILSPLCGWGLVGPYAALERGSSAVVSAFGPNERRALAGLSLSSRRQSEITIKVNDKINVKGNGRECPFHAGNVKINFKGSGRGRPLYTVLFHRGRMFSCHMVPKWEGLIL